MAAGAAGLVLLSWSLMDLMDSGRPGDPAGSWA